MHETDLSQMMIFQFPFADIQRPTMCSINLLNICPNFSTISDSRIVIEFPLSYKR